MEKGGAPKKRLSAAETKLLTWSQTWELIAAQPLQPPHGTGMPSIVPAQARLASHPTHHSLRRSTPSARCNGDDVPEYAILSHTWSAQEVTLQEWSRRHEPSVSSKSGHQKILSACRLASAHRLRYVWVDTNCIDKTSSAELSEAINGMFDWYGDAQVCLVHLEDVVLDPKSDASGAALTALFRSSRWFTRGWTLQELSSRPSFFASTTGTGRT